MCIRDSPGAAARWIVHARASALAQVAVRRAVVAEADGISPAARQGVQVADARMIGLAHQPIVAVVVEADRLVARIALFHQVARRIVAILPLSLIHI